MKKAFPLKRMIFDLVMLFGVFLFPFWLTGVIALLGLIFFYFFVEFVVVFFGIELLFARGVFSPWALEMRAMLPLLAMLFFVCVQITRGYVRDRMMRR